MKQALTEGPVGLWLPQDVRLIHCTTSTNTIPRGCFLSSWGMCEVSIQGGLKPAAALQFTIYVACTAERACLTSPFLLMRLFWQKAKRRNIVCEHKPTIRTRSGKAAQPNVANASPAQPTSRRTQAVGGLFVVDVINPWRALTHPSWQKTSLRPSCRPLYNPLQYENFCKCRKAGKLFFAHRMEQSELAFCLSLFWNWYLCSNWCRISRSLLVLLSKTRMCTVYGHLRVSKTKIVWRLII